jgi:hypothetical protein
MYMHHFKGFHGTPSRCEVCYGKINGQPAIVFRQHKLVGTSITNFIEELSNDALNKHMQGIDPKAVRIFEHYVPALNPIGEWREVRFQSAHLVDDRVWSEKILDALFFFARTPMPLRSSVSDPSWSPVSSADQCLAASVP